ncbi:MAG: flagellar protein FliS, partial [Butyrivibrio sp.]|nr:flagellar protein FliS [Butyrivibrio sp.]
YLFYVYSMHKLKFWRLYHEELTKRGLTLDAFASREYREAGDILEPYTRSTDSGDDVVQVMEFWYRQPFDAKGIRAGTVGCSIQAGGVELRNIPNYWQKTGGQNDRFPFVHYWCIRDETQFWNRSELEPILPLVDAADRELINGLFNDEMQSNDLMVAEDNAVYDMALEYMDDGKNALAEEHFDDADFALKHARACLDDLIGALDMQYEMSAGLMQLYLFCKRELSAAQGRRDASRIANARTVIEKIREAWVQIEEHDTSDASFDNAQTVYAGLTYGKGTLNESVSDPASNRGLTV